MTPEPAWPSVSVIVPTLQAAVHLPGCLESIWAQEHDEAVEVIVADGGSTDGTRELVLEARAAGRPITLVDNAAGIQAAGLNRAAEAASHELLVRCDAHARLPRGALRALAAEHLLSPHANVGGVQSALPPGRPWPDAVAAIYGTTMGSGGAAYRRQGRARDVDTVYLGSWWRRDLLAIGGFDERFAVNEDAELNLRWRLAGGRVRLLPDLHVGYVPRATPGALARQYLRYGTWRARTARLHSRLGPRQVLALGPLASVLLATTRRRGLSLPGVAYAGSLALSASRLPVPASRKLLAAAALATMHLSWGAGFVAGAVLPLPWRSSPRAVPGSSPVVVPVRPRWWPGRGAR